MITTERRIAADHPAAIGHFPGNPLMPGAYLLAEVLAVIEEKIGVIPLPYILNSVKFLHPVRPGDLLKFELEIFKDHIIFTCGVGTKSVLSGSIQCYGDLQIA